MKTYPFATEFRNPRSKMHDRVILFRTKKQAVKDCPNKRLRVLSNKTALRWMKEYANSV